MIILPAIDLLEGNAVRLSKGEYNTAKIYSNDPKAILTEFCRCGAVEAHIVDLDGAKAGSPVNMQIIKELAKIMPIEIGGGIRTLDAANQYINLGVRRIIMGSAVAKDISLAAEGVKKFGAKFAVGVDAKCGKVAVSGWTAYTSLDSFDFVRELAEIGVSTVIYTDIDTDGMLKGTNISAFEKLAPLKINIIASGGVSTVGDIKALSSLGIYGAIVGKALYENKLSLCDAINAAT